MTVDHKTLRKRAVDAGTARQLSSPESSMAGAFADGVARFLETILKDDEALDAARRAYLNSPPYATSHDVDGRRAHMRATLLAAFTDAPIAGVDDA